MLAILKGLHLQKKILLIYLSFAMSTLNDLPHKDNIWFQSWHKLSFSCIYIFQINHALFFGS